MGENANTYQICSRCVMDNRSDNTISFAADGTCNYCTDVLKRMALEYFPNEQGREYFNNAIQRIKKACIEDEFDCIVGISGGLDSSYVLHLGYTNGLRMLAIHIDDGLNTSIASSNISKICEKTGTKLITMQPNMEQYKDSILAFFKASVPNFAIPQDNLIIKALRDTARKYNIKYVLSGGNFALESILQRGCTHNAFDVKHIKSISKQFGTKLTNELKFIGFFGYYISERYLNKVEKIYLLNYIDYNLREALAILESNYGYQYYGGKHYESVLTRFLQCYYLPVKFLYDKRRSHFSSMIISGQMRREDAMDKLDQSPYASQELLELDCNTLAEYFGLSRAEFDRIVAFPAKQHDEYVVSFINKFAPLARKFRKYLG